MRNIDLIFVIALGIAMGSILGKVWSVTPSGLVLYQATLICVVWFALRVALDCLQKLGRIIARQKFMSQAFWFSGVNHDMQKLHYPRKPRPAPAARSSEFQDRATLDNFLKNSNQL